MSSVFPSSLSWRSAAAPLRPSHCQPVHLTRPSLRHAHEMPFGPVRIDPHDTRSGYRFRLWAPSARQVSLQLSRAHGGDRRVPCTLRDGWHVAEVPQARAGDHYSFLVDGLQVPDPASRYNPGDVHAPSQIIDPRSFDWGEAPWLGRPWHEAVLYELHVGTFTPEGTFKAAQRRLDYLAGMGVTAIQLMPLGDFAGRRGWGHDGVLPFAPESTYGHPNDLKQFIRSAQERGIMVLLDVVWHRLGAEGNYLRAYAPECFGDEAGGTEGPSLDLEPRSGSGGAREFLMHNALYWLTEYRLDGLRIHAAHTLHDRSPVHVLQELASRARAACAGRHIHLLLDHDDNRASLLGPPGSPGLADAQRNTDFQHAAHVLLTGDADGAGADFAADPLQHLVRCLTEGFAFQGEVSRAAQRRRGEPSRHLPATAFINGLQSHDQVGARPGGERLGMLAPAHRLQALVALQLLSPGIPMIFMGEEFAATTPFLYHCDAEPSRTHALRATQPQGGVTATGRRQPDPCDPASALASKLDWQQLHVAAHRQWLEQVERLLAERHRVIVPLLPRLVAGGATCHWWGARAFTLRWPTDDGQQLVLTANLGEQPDAAPGLPDASPHYSVGGAPDAKDRLPAWSVHYFVTQGVTAIVPA